MKENVGSHVKLIAMINLIVGVISSLIWGIILASKQAIALAFIYILGGIFVSWVLATILYAFGHLVENSDKSLVVTRKNYDTQQKILEELENMGKTTTQKDVVLTNVDKKVPEGKVKITTDILDKIVEVFSNFSTDDIKELQESYEGLQRKAKSLTTEELIEVIRNVEELKSPYNVLCCVELDKRRKKESKKDKLSFFFSCAEVPSLA